MAHDVLTSDKLIAIHQKIKPHVHQTPVLTCSTFNQLLNSQLFFKCENFQKIGAFKYRGATNAILTLTENTTLKGVTTHSSGNHAQAVAMAASKHQIKAKIVMPETAPKVKIAAVKGYGAEVILCPPTLVDRENYMSKIVEESGYTPIHPFNDYNIIGGQSTVAQELLKEVPQLDYILAPVGGGGLLSGTALAAHYFSPSTQVIGCEPEGANDAFLSFQQNEITPIDCPKSIADGLLTTIGQRNFPIVKEHVSSIQTVNDEEIVAAMRMIWERMKIVIEPSAAVSFAVALKIKPQLAGKEVGILISGGNVDLGHLPFS